MLVSLVSLLGALALVAIGPQRIWDAVERCWRKWFGRKKK